MDPLRSLRVMPLSYKCLFVIVFGSLLVFLVISELNDPVLDTQEKSGKYLSIKVDNITCNLNPTG